MIVLLKHISKKDKESLLGSKEAYLYQECEQETRDMILRVVQSGKNWEGEIKVIDSQNETKWLFSNIHPIFDENYNVVEYTNVFHDISSKKKIEEISNTDALTNLYNRRYFDSVFPKQIKIHTRNKQLLTFAMIDIDFFKQYNDIYGHPAVDATLKRVAQTLKSSLSRPDDYVFRLGGEEFGVLFGVDSVETATRLTQKILEDVESLSIPHAKNSASESVTISMGTLVVSPQIGLDPQSLYKQADELLYKAKESGRNSNIIETL